MIHVYAIEPKRKSDQPQDGTTWYAVTNINAYYGGKYCLNVISKDIKDCFNPLEIVVSRLPPTQERLNKWFPSTYRILNLDELKILQKSDELKDIRFI